MPPFVICGKPCLSGVASIARSPVVSIAGAAMSDRPLAGRIALVTGASRGIGRALALALASAGAHVVAVARTKGALEELDDEITALGGSATLVPLNLVHGDKLDQLGPSLYPRFQRLDMLVAAAGMLGPLSPLAHVKTEDWTRLIEVNLTANWRLIRTLDPLLRLSPSGRAVFVTCDAARAREAYWGPYAASKAGLEALVASYAAEVASTPVRVNLLDPGIARTKLRQQAFPGETPSTQPDPARLGPVVLEMLSPAYTENGAIIEAFLHPGYL
jgi:NAD(P)-dependent dehydrogenase (short-subunit alcohol dehydrogenase family)